MQISLAGKRVFITAGAAGMGRSTAISMRNLGAEVFICDIDEDAIDAMPEGITAFVADVSSSTELDAVFSRILGDGLDVLVNNAGIAGPTKLIEDITNDEWRQTMSVGIDAQFYCARRVVPVFKRQQSGSIINMVSAAGIMGFPNRTPYAAAKWAVTGFTKTLAMELGPDNIRVNGVVPGNVSGERIEKVIQAHARKENIDPEAVRQLYAVSTSMQCYIDPQEVADMVCFLASDHTKHVSGQIIGVDGNTETLYPRFSDNNGTEPL